MGLPATVPTTAAIARTTVATVKVAAKSARLAFRQSLKAPPEPPGNAYVPPAEVVSTAIGILV
jgi:hypothetical protein